MNSDVLFLFLILLFGLLVCSFLGNMYPKEGMKLNNNRNQDDNSDDSDSDDDDSSISNNYDNYNHFSKESSPLSTGNTFYSESGGTVTVGTNNDGSQSLTLTLAKGGNPITLNQSKEGYTNYSSSNDGAIKFYGPNNTSATVVKKNGQTAIKITTDNDTTIFTQQGSISNTNNNSPSRYYGATGTYGGPVNPPGPAGGSGSGYNPPGPAGGYGSGSGYNPPGPAGGYGSGYNPPGPAGGYGSGYNPPGPAGGYGSGSGYNPPGPAGGYGSGSGYNPPGPRGGPGVGAPGAGALPDGIPRRMIPGGDEDLYILKSEVVPPVCPACPSAASCPRQEPCPACPPCGRCPEAPFECKKVPNYNAISDRFLPAPVVNSFSSF